MYKKFEGLESSESMKLQFFVLSNDFDPNNQKMLWPTWIFQFEHSGTTTLEA